MNVTGNTRARPLFSRYAQSGISLAEVMIAVTLGLFIISGLVQLFISNKRQYQITEAYARLQESGRFAIEMLGRDIRNAGYAGCRGNRNPTANANTYWGTTAPLTGYDANDNPATPNESVTAWTPALPTSLPTPTSRSERRGDVLSIRHVYGNPLPLLSTMAKPTDDPRVSPYRVGYGPAANDIVIISDCRDSTAFKVSKADPLTGILLHASVPNLNKAYGTTADVMTIAETTYFVDRNAAGRTSLYRTDSAGVARELVHGVENIQVLYGIDTDADLVPNQYVTAAHPGLNWDNVVAVRLELLLASPDDNLADLKQAYLFNEVLHDGLPGKGHGAIPVDARLRRVFLTTVSLRSMQG